MGMAVGADPAPPPEALRLGGPHRFTCRSLLKGPRLDRSWPQLRHRPSEPVEDGSVAGNAVGSAARAGAAARGGEAGGCGFDGGCAGDGADGAGVAGAGDATGTSMSGTLPARRSASDTFGSSTSPENWCASAVDSSSVRGRLLEPLVVLWAPLVSDSIEHLWVCRVPTLGADGGCPQRGWAGQSLPSRNTSARVPWPTRVPGMKRLRCVGVRGGHRPKAHVLKVRYWKPI